MAVLGPWRFSRTDAAGSRSILAAREALHGARPEQAKAAAMSSPEPDVRVTLSSRVEHVFPTLTPEQVARVAAHGRVRPVRSGEVLVSAGQQAESFFVVKTGSIELVRKSAKGEEIVAVQRPGQFTGETNMPSGRQALVSLRVGES